MTKTTSEVRVKNANKDVVGQQSYDKVNFDLPKDEATDKLLGESIAFYQEKAGKDGDGVRLMLGKLTYGYDLEVRNKIRLDILATILGPEKAITKAVQNIVRARQIAGKPVSEAEARELLGL